MAAGRSPATPPGRSRLDRYRFTGEFHYFRLPRGAWADRLAQVRELGFQGVSIYVPWNWHMPAPATVDLDGRTLPERDLLGALDAIATAGLDCIYRPGPFITAEWRDGGIPAWLWQADPTILALDAAGRPAGAGRPYPALTYAHSGYERPAVRWLTSAIAAAAPYLASQGGPIVNLQLDDEPSYWQGLGDPLALDYNPFLVAAVDGRPSRYAAWLLRRHGSLAALNAAHHARWTRAADVQPPRAAMTERTQLTRHTDWLDFKLDLINEHVVVLARASREAGYVGPLSMLFPYLLPLGAAKFAAFAREHQLDLELTNECYVSLFGATSCPEQKVAHVIACHETYHMWRGPDQGPAFSMELQGSNSSFIGPGVMELLYAVTLARGIRGFNVYMLVGGQNPVGFENGTGRDYDLDAPIGSEGQMRPHADVLGRQLRVCRALERILHAAEPLRDTWIGFYTPYESAALVAGRGAFADVAAATAGLFSAGDFGLSDALSLPALLTLANVSWGALDVERGDERAWRRARQVWLPGLAFMARPVQERIVAWIEAGGHLVILPGVPTLDERMAPCDVLARRIFGSGALPDFQADDSGRTDWSQVRLLGGGSLTTPGGVARMALPPSATTLATADDGAVVGFRRPLGAGSATVLGFRLQYHPVGGRDQFAFAAALVEGAVGGRAATTDTLPVVALELAGTEGGLLCVVNPVEPAASARVTYTRPGSTDRATLPRLLPSLEFAGRGARLLPIGIGLGSGRTLRHATAELVNRRLEEDGAVRLAFAPRQGERFEVAVSGWLGAFDVEGGRVVDSDVRAVEETVLVIDPARPEVALVLPAVSPRRER